MTFHIRDATQADVPALAALHVQTFNETHLLRRVQRQGLGRQLRCSVARRFLEQGISSMVLFGEATSPSNGFYEAFGAERLYAANGEFHGGYGWRDVQTLLALCGTA